MTPRRNISAGEIYHVYNRGVEKRDVFIDDEDYFRFVHALYEFNDRDYVLNFSNFIDSQVVRGLPINRAIENFRELIRSKKRDLLVDIICLCLMPNHFHLILRSLTDDGIALFMQKLGSGYTLYFNYKYNRVGSLFQGVYKAKHIPDDRYFMHCTGYVHRNPLELAEPKWKEEGFSDSKKAEEALMNYRWSSFLDCIGEKNIPSVINNNFLMKMFDNDPVAYKKFVLEWTEKDLQILKEAKLTFEE